MQVTLPDMGESVTEGTVAKWLKQPGDPVREGEALVEVTTDKVDAEVPAPATGKLVKILADAGQTIAVGAPLAEIEVGADGGVPAAKETTEVEAAPQPGRQAAPQPGPKAARRGCCARQAHGGKPRGPDGDQLSHRAGRCARSAAPAVEPGHPECRASGEALVHAPDRFCHRQGGEGRALDGDNV